MTPAEEDPPPALLPDSIHLFHVTERKAARIQALCGGQGGPAQAHLRRPLREALHRVPRQASPRCVREDLRAGARQARREEGGGLVRALFAPRLFRFLATSRSTRSSGRTAGTTCRRSLRPDGRRPHLRRAGAGAAGVSRRLRGARESGPAALVRGRLPRRSRIFSLDLDLSGFDAMLGDAPELRRALARGGGRMLRGPTLFEDAVKMLLTTNCSWAATRGMVTRLVADRRETVGAFPAPAAVARLRPRVLRERVRCGYRGGGAVALRAPRRLRAARLSAVGAPRRVRRRDPRGDPGRARVRTLRRRRTSAHPRPPRVPRPRFVGAQAVPQAPSRARRRRWTARSRGGTRATASYRGLALWLELTRGWHEGDDPGRRSIAQSSCRRPRRRLIGRPILTPV